MHACMHVGTSHVYMLCYDSANSTDFQLWNIIIDTLSGHLTPAEACQAPLDWTTRTLFLL